MNPTLIDDKIKIREAKCLIQHSLMRSELRLKTAGSVDLMGRFPKITCLHGFPLPAQKSYSQQKSGKESGVITEPLEDKPAQVGVCQPLSPVETATGVSPWEGPASPVPANAASGTPRQPSLPGPCSPLSTQPL